MKQHNNYETQISTKKKCKRNMQKM